MDELSKRAMSLWPDLAGQMGMAPGAVQVAPLARRQDARVDMVALLLKLTSGRELVLKLQDRPKDAEEFAEAMQGHMRSFEAFPEGVPELLAVDFDAQACVMEWVAGDPLATVLQEAPVETHPGIMRQAGAWLGQFHRATLGESRVFQPKYTMDYLRDVVDEVKSGKRDVAEKRKFLSCAEGFLARQHLYEGRRTQAAQTHGDMHMRNLLMGEQVKGIDFSAARIVPVGHDIARLLSDYAILRAQHDDIRPGEVVPVEVRDAFFDGYGVVRPDDPSVQLLLRHRVLAEWWGLPASETKRSVAQERRWQGIASLVEKVFPEA